MNSLEQILSMFIKTFPDIDKKILILYLHEKLTFFEVAEILEISISEVIVSYIKAIDKIKKKIAAIQISQGKV